MLKYFILLFYFLLNFNHSNAQVFPQISISTDTNVINKGRKVKIKAFYDKSIDGGITWKKNGVAIFSNVDSIALENIENNDKIVCTRKVLNNKSETSTLSSNILTFKVIEDYTKLKFESSGYVGDSLKINSPSTYEIQWYYNGIKLDNPLVNNSLRNGEKIIGTDPKINELTSPGKITLDKNGYIYFADKNTNRIIKCNPNGKNCEVIAGGNGEGSNQNQFASPNKILVDSLGYVYVLDTYNNRIQRWGTGSNLGETIMSAKNSINGINQNPDLLGSTRDFTIDKEENVFVLNFTSILKFPKGSNTGKLYAGGNGYGQNLNQIYDATNFQIDSIGSAYFVQGGSIRKWQKGAAFSEIIIGNGSSFDKYNPLDFILDKNNDIIFSAYGGLHKFNNKEGKITQIGFRNKNLGDIIPYDLGYSGISLSENFIYFWSANDKNGYSLLKISNDSSPTISLLYEFNNYGSKNDQITSPTSLELDNEGNILISDNYYKLVKFDSPKFNSSKVYSLKASIYKSHFYFKNSIYYSGYEQFRRINLIDGNDELLFKWNGAGNLLNQLNSPTEFHFLNDTTYISDKQNSRIVRWKYFDDLGEVVTKPSEIFDPLILKIINKQNLIVGNFASIYKIDLISNKTTLIYKNANVSFNSNSRLDSLGNFYFISSNNKIIKLNPLSLSSNTFATIDNFSPPTNGGNISYNGKFFQINKSGDLFVLDNVFKKVFKYYRNNNSSLFPKLPGEYSAIIKNESGQFKIASIILKMQDSDKDGVDDGLDKCPNTLAGEQVDSNGCSLSQKDTDNDGVNDKIDKCSNSKTGFKVDSNGCADYQKDSDNDGITDDLDKCPDTPKGLKVDSKGCSDEQNTCSAVKPSIKYNNGTEIATSTTGITYNWYLNDTLLIESKFPTIIPLKSGKYSIKVLVSDKCLSGISDYVSVLITSTKEELSLINAFPNPFNKEIKIEFPIEFGFDVKVSISDIKGSIVYSKERVINSEILNLSHLSSGTYFLSIIDKDSILKKLIKLIKE